MAEQTENNTKGIVIVLFGAMFLSMGLLIGFVLGYDMGRFDGFKLGVDATAEYMRDFNNVPQAPAEKVPEEHGI